MKSENLPDCECSVWHHRECGNKGTIVVKDRDTGNYHHICPDAHLNHCPERFYETVRKLA